MSKGFGWKKPEEIKLLGEDELFCGIVQHPVSRKWQTWVSFEAIDIQCITAHNKRDDADKVAKQIIAAWESGNLETQEEVTAFLKSLPSDDVPSPLPQDVVVRLSKKILRK